MPRCVRGERHNVRNAPWQAEQVDASADDEGVREAVPSAIWYLVPNAAPRSSLALDRPSVLRATLNWGVRAPIRSRS